jgi:purine-cytosine permease-like protein
LILAGYEGLGGFGKFMGVLVALGLIANNIPGTYSASLGFQIMGCQLARLPRWFYSCVGVVIYTACALGGRNHLYEIFDDWLALMGYWVTIYLIIAIEEHLIFADRLDLTGMRGRIRPNCRSGLRHYWYFWLAGPGLLFRWTRYGMLDLLRRWLANMALIWVFGLVSPGRCWGTRRSDGWN